MSKMIYVIYKCKCMHKDRQIEIQERGLTEDVRDFVQRVQEVIGNDHADNFPTCREEKMEYAKIPALQGIGFDPGKPQ